MICFIISSMKAKRSILITGPTEQAVKINESSNKIQIKKCLVKKLAITKASKGIKPQLTNYTPTVTSDKQSSRQSLT